MLPRSGIEIPRRPPTQRWFTNPRISVPSLSKFTPVSLAPPTSTCAWKSNLLPPNRIENRPGHVRQNVRDAARLKRIEGTRIPHFQFRSKARIQIPTGREQRIPFIARLPCEGTLDFTYEYPIPPSNTGATPGNDGPLRARLRRQSQRDQQEPQFEHRSHKPLSTPSFL